MAWWRRNGHESWVFALLKQASREILDMIICATDGEIETVFEQVKVPNSVQVIWLI